MLVWFITAEPQWELLQYAVHLPPWGGGDCVNQEENECADSLTGQMTSQGA